MTEGAADVPSRAEAGVAAALHSILGGLADGAELPHDPYALPPFFTPLEYYLPAVLRQAYPKSWPDSFDAFRLAQGRRTGPRSAELLGLAQFITDQTWTPFELHLRLAADADEVEWLHVWVGEPDASGKLLRVPYGARQADRLLRDLCGRRDEVPWMFEVVLGD